MERPRRPRPPQVTAAFWLQLAVGSGDAMAMIDRLERAAMLSNLATAAAVAAPVLVVATVGMLATGPSRRFFAD